MKMRMNYPGGHYIMKSCMQSESCSSVKMMFLSYGFELACCKTDNCNAAGFKRANLKVLLIAVNFFIMYLFIDSSLV